MPKIRLRHAVLPLILAIGAWALWPSRGGGDTVRLGTDPAKLRNLPPTVKYIIRMDPGAYLPGLKPDNVGRPLEGIARVAAEFEKLYPDTRLQFVPVPSIAREWLVTQLSSGQAPDIIQVNVEDVWQDVQKHWYIPLDNWLNAPHSFAAPGQPGSIRWWDIYKYITPTRGTCAPDGRFYCVTLDMIETGIYYNKDIFARLGLREPKDWPEFIQIQKTLKQNGYIPMLIEKQGLTDWGVDLTFYQVYSDLADVLDLRYDPSSGDYLKGYLDWDELAFLHTRGFFTPRDPRWVSTFRILKDWRQYMAKDLTSTDMLKAFVTERGAMYWSTSMLVNRLTRDPDIHFQWGVFYLPPIPRSFNKFCAGREQCVIGGSGMQYSITNSALRDTDPKLPIEQRIKNSERVKRCIAFLQYLTTPKSAETVVNEMVRLLPNVKGATFHPDLAPFDKFLQQHYSMSKWFFTFDLQFDEVMIRMFELYLNDGISESEYLDWMDKNLATACDRVIRRKNLDLKPLQAEYNKRRMDLAQFTDLPPGAL